MEMILESDDLKMCSTNFRYTPGKWIGAPETHSCGPDGELAAL